MKRLLYLSIGLFSCAVGLVGIFLPLLPTIPFIIFAAFCFASSNPDLERRIVEHPRFAHHIIAWRSRGAISRSGKTAALSTFAASALIGVLALPFPAVMLPIAAGLVGGGWILSRPTA